MAFSIMSRKERKYHLNEWLTMEHRRLLGKDNLLVLCHAFAQYSEAFDTLSTQEAGRYNGLPVQFVVAKLCHLLGMPPWNDQIPAAKGAPRRD